MFLSKISLLNFRNYPEASIEANQHVNCFTGPNGSGKTNLLDAIYYLSMTKSYFSSADNQNIRQGASLFIIQGDFVKNGIRETVYAGVKSGQKKQFKINQKEYERLADHIGLFPVVMVAPTDQELVTEGSETRRKFLDVVISQYDHNYLEDLIQYHQILSHRNALLKDLQRRRERGGETLEIWDVRLVDFGNRIHKKRSSFINEFESHFDTTYKSIAGTSEPVAIHYESRMNNDDLRELLDNGRQRDIDQGFTGHGIHKDDLLIQLNGMPAKKFASQGQQKSLVTALKLAQYSYLVARGFTRPIVLLDDIFDKLDQHRVSRLLNLVTGEKFGQVFITDTDPNRASQFFEKSGIPFKVFHVEENSIQPLTVLENEQQ